MIVYFTGTGNSRRAAQLLADRLEDQLTDSVAYLRRGERLNLISQRPWIFVSPTYAWQLPRVFAELLRNGRFTGSRDAYFVMTCGDSVGNAEHYIRKLCGEIGLRFCGLLPVVMPENYLAMFDVPDKRRADAIIRQADDVLEAAVPEIRAEHYLNRVPGKLIGMLQSGPVNAAFYRFIVKDKAFRTTDACVGCGNCTQVCPMNNLSIRDARPVWGGNCIHCMACICSCPRNAIEYGDKSKDKPRYQCPQWGEEESRRNHD